MFLIVPHSANVPMSRWPIANFLLIGLAVAAYVAQRALPAGTIEALILRGWSLPGMLGHIWLHGGMFHLAGNLLFLWVFGNAVCAKVGNLCYPMVYVALGLVAAAIHVALDGHPAVGASGAVNGIVGMFLVFYPLNWVSCFYMFFLRFGSFTVSSFWVILLWLVFDIVGAALGAGGVAYYAHLGGFFAGFALASVLLAFNVVRMEPDERSLLRLLGLAGVAAAAEEKDE